MPRPVILETDALNGGIDYRQYVATDYSAANPSRAPRPGRRQWLASVALATCAALVTLGLVLGPYSHARGQGLLPALVVCSPVMLLRRWPLLVLAAAVMANALAMAEGIAALSFGIMLGFGSYLTASRLPRQVSIPAAAASAAVLGAAIGYATLLVRGAAPAAEVVQGLLPLAAAWFIGDSVAARRRYQAGLAEQRERERAAEAERGRHQVHAERVRIARELHDVVAHTLAVITVQAGVGRRLAGKHPEQATTALESIETIGRTAQDELHVVLGLLRDEENATPALAPAPRLEDIKELVDTVRASGTPVDLRLSGTERLLSPALELSIYRVIQEALTNVVKHAPGARVTVGLTVSARLVRLDVTDDGGSATVPASHETKPGLGIVGMRERIGAFGGWLVAEPLADRGFRVTAEVPVEGAP
jgi:signal transduction histidine kinase